MDSLLRLLIITLFVTVTFSLGSEDIVKTFVEFSGQIGGYPTATQISASPVIFTGYPGQALISIQAVSSVAVCVSPYAAVTSNLQTQCPNPPVNFFYNPLDVESEFLLFLDDFSMNFMGRDGRSSAASNKKTDRPYAAPYTTQNGSISLLQNVPYYVSIGLIDDFAANSTELEIIDFQIYTTADKCRDHSAPNPQFGKNGSVECIHLQSELSPTNTSASVTVSQARPLFFSFNITTLTLEANLDFHVHSLDFNLSFFIGFGYVPNENQFDYSFQNSSSSLNDDEYTTEFLGDLISSFSYSIQTPKVGTYFVRVNSGLTNETKFDIEFNTTVCNLLESSTCGPLSINTVYSANQTMQTINLTSTTSFLAIVGQTVSLGIQTAAGDSPVFYQVDVNAIPNMVPTATPPPYQQAVGNTVGISLQSPESLTFVFGFALGAGITLPTAEDGDYVEALLWTGSVCPLSCSGNGNCNLTSFVCSCAPEYSGVACEIEAPVNPPPQPPGSPPANEKKKFSTLYIILIIIGGAILLAVLIGVPVALFLNNRKKARYERV